MIIPNFIIAGERRSGTTSLTRWMDNHPQIFLHPHVDMGYFIDDKTKGRKDSINGQVDPEEWWINHSKEDYMAKFKNAKTQIAVGEKSADYFYWDHAHSRIRKILPEVKFIVILRNPVDRAWSHYWNEVGKGRESLSFKEAIKLEDYRMKKSDYYRNHFSYISRGYYDLSYQKFLNNFNKEKIFLLTLDDLKADPISTIKKVYKFLGVDENLGLKKSGQQHNKNWTTFQTPFVQKVKVLSYLENNLVKGIRKILIRLIKDPFKRNKLQLNFESKFRRTKESLEMDQKLKSELKEIYLPHVESLERMTGMNLTYWKNF